MDMHRIVFIIILILITLASGFANSAELTFPKTEQEIVNALSLKDDQTVFEGVEYISEKGKVYKIISGKRYRLRGLQSIVDSDILPRAGALIYFDFNSAKLRNESFALLDEFGKALNGDLDGAVIIIAGHTDDQGSNEYIQELSKKRATAVARYLKLHHHIGPNRIVVKGFGENKPIAFNDSEPGRFLNRRVEFIRVE